MSQSLKLNAYCIGMKMKKVYFFYTHKLTSCKV